MSSPLLKALLVSLLPLFLQAGALISGRIYTKPEKLFINQPFEIILEVAVTPGQDIDDIRIQGFPSDPAFITLGRLEPGQRRSSQPTGDGKVADVLSFQANARCHKSISMQFSPILSCSVVQRRSRGFFSSSFSSPAQIRINPFTLTIHELPQSGRPAHFSGAVGRFTLQGALSKNQVRPGDIIKLQLDLKGQGWLANAPMPTPDLSESFKSYPPKETLRQADRITSEQLFIPLSTNAFELGAAHFSYFNPQSERYEECRSPVFKLQFVSAESTALTNQVKVISTDAAPSAAHTPAVSINIREVNEVFRQILPAVIGCIFILAASFMFLVLIKINRWLAAAVTILILGAGTLAAFSAARREPAVQVELKQPTAVYLTPSVKSPVIMQLRASTRVTPLESTDRWIRIESSRQRGWIEREQLAPR